MTAKRKTTKRAVKIIHRRYYKGKPQRQRALDRERVNAHIADAIYRLRTRAGMTQRDLARLVGTTASVICRLEDADYEGHSLSMLQRIADAFNRKIEVRFVPRSKDPVSS